jgi:hypothetical protein
LVFSGEYIRSELSSKGCLSFPLVGNLSLKKDAGQAGMTKIQSEPQTTFKIFGD